MSPRLDLVTQDIAICHLAPLADDRMYVCLLLHQGIVNVSLSSLHVIISDTATQVMTKILVK